MKLGVTTLTEQILISFPKYYRNNTWGNYFGKIQDILRDTQSIGKKILLDFSVCTWVDPLPIMSLLIELHRNKYSKIIVIFSEIN